MARYCEACCTELLAKKWYSYSIAIEFRKDVDRFYKQSNVYGEDIQHNFQSAFWFLTIIVNPWEGFGIDQGVPGIILQVVHLFHWQESTSILCWLTIATISCQWFNVQRNYHSQSQI